jgi:hypothetical protein
MTIPRPSSKAASAAIPASPTATLALPRYLNFDFPLISTGVKSTCPRLVFCMERRLSFALIASVFPAPHYFDSRRHSSFQRIDSRSSDARGKEIWDRCLLDGLWRGDGPFGICGKVLDQALLLAYILVIVS